MQVRILLCWCITYIFDEHGNITKGTLGVYPLSVYKYLKNTNKKQLIKIPENDDKYGEVLDRGSEYKYHHFF